MATAPLWGIAFANPLLDLISSGRRLAKEWALADLEGRNYEFKGKRIRVAQDEWGRCWLPADDVRKVLPQLPRDSVLPAALAGGARCLVPGGSLHVEAAALEASLRQAHNMQTIAFKRWLERDVMGPAARHRAQQRPSAGSLGARKHG